MPAMRPTPAPPPMRALDPARDAAALHAIFGDPESCRYLPRPAHTEVAQTRALLERWTVGYEHTSWVTVDEADRATGRIAIYMPHEGVWEAACMIVPAARGQGLAQRALPVAIDHGFDVEGARRIQVDIDPDNLPSIRTFERLGFQHEGRLRASWVTHLGVRDAVILSLLPTDPRPWRLTSPGGS